MYALECRVPNAKAAFPAALGSHGQLQARQLQLPVTARGDESQIHRTDARNSRLHEILEIFATSASAALVLALCELGDPSGEASEA